MPVFSSHAPSTPCWVDLSSPDVDAARAFYPALFGWQAEDQFDDEGNRIYTLFSLGGHLVAGLGGMPPGTDGMPGMWNSYIAVADCAATVAKVEAAGGTVMMPPMQVMTAGEMAVCADPTGAVFSLWKAGEHRGAGICNEPNTYAWNELLDRDLATAKAFYSQVFGWDYEVSDMGEMGQYTVIAGGENGGLGGMMDMPDAVPAEVPNHWMVYFTVADAAATAAAATAAGGAVVDGPFDVPGVGRIAVLADPTGASFSLMQPADA